MRRKIPKNKEAEILFLNRHICCICHDDDKVVQIHHIDDNNSNNILSNLAVLCLNCHSKVTGAQGLGKKYSTLELKKYKSNWESIVKKKYKFPEYKKLREIPKIEKQLFVFEIKKIIYEMTAADDKQTFLFDKNLEILWQISLLEDIQKEIIEHLNFAYTLTSISSVNKPIALARHLPHFFNYLVGPTEVKMNKKDEKNVIEAIETIEFSCNLSVDRNKNYKILNAFKNSLSDFIQIAIKYKKNNIFKKAIKILKSIKMDCNKIYYDGDRKMPRLIKEIDGLFKDINKELKKEKLNWKI